MLQMISYYMISCMQSQAFRRASQTDEIQKKQIKRKLLSDIYKILKFFQNNHQLIMTQKDSDCEAFAVFYQEKLLENDNENSDESSNTAVNAAIMSNFKSKKICICELEH